MTEPNENNTPKYKTILEDWEHHTVLMALMYYKMSQEYLKNKGVQDIVKKLEEKIASNVKEVEKKDKVESSPERYSDLFFDDVMKIFNTSEPATGPKKVELTSEEKIFLKVMLENYVIAGSMMGISMERIFVIMSIIKETYKRTFDKGNDKGEL